MRAERASGGVLVRWHPSATPGVEYRVVRLGADGSRRVLGSTRATELEDGEPPRDGVPVYAVIARRAGVSADEVRSSSGPAAPASPGAAPAPAATPGPDLPPVVTLTALPHRNRVRLVFAPPAAGRAEVRRLPSGGRPPEPAAAVPADLGAAVPGMGPGLALDARPVEPTSYVVLTVDGGRAVAGASVTVAQLPPLAELRLDRDRLQWTWPPGCTEALVVWRLDSPPEGPGDPRAEQRKTTNTRYDLDDGAVAARSAAAARGGLRLRPGGRRARDRAGGRPAAAAGRWDRGPPLG